MSDTLVPATTLSIATDSCGLESVPAPVPAPKKAVGRPKKPVNPTADKVLLAPADEPAPSFATLPSVPAEVTAAAIAAVVEAPIAVIPSDELHKLKKSYRKVQKERDALKAELEALKASYKEKDDKAEALRLKRNEASKKSKAKAAEKKKAGAGDVAALAEKVEVLAKKVAAIAPKEESDDEEEVKAESSGSESE